MFSLFVATAIAACAPKFGILQPNGSWSFYPEKVAGSKEVEVDAETCQPVYRALKEVSGKYVIDKTMLDAAKAAEAKEKSDEVAAATLKETKLARAKVLRALGSNRTLAESNELIDLQTDFLILLWQKAN